MQSPPTETISNFADIMANKLGQLELKVIQRRLMDRKRSDISRDLGLQPQKTRAIESRALKRLTRYVSHFKAYVKVIEDCLGDHKEVMSIQDATELLRERSLLYGSIFSDAGCIFSLANIMKVETRYRKCSGMIATTTSYIEFEASEKERREIIDRIASFMQQRTCGIIPTKHDLIAQQLPPYELEDLLDLGKHDLRLFRYNDTDWLSIASGRCYLASKAAKVFFILQDCDIESLGKQLYRSLQAKRFEARDDISHEVIATWIRSSGRFHIEGQTCSCTETKEPSIAERAVVDALKIRNQCTMSELRKVLRGQLTKENLNQILGFSPLIVCDQTAGRRNYLYKLFAAQSKPRNVATGAGSPGQRTVTIEKYKRCVKVSDYVLQRAGGICESCQREAPFTRDDGTLYLEIHHLKMLADGGSDTVSNAIAVCPNCHRELHHGANRAQIKRRLYITVSRLKPE